MGVVSPQRDGSLTRELAYRHHRNGPAEEREREMRVTKHTKYELHVTPQDYKCFNQQRYTIICSW